MHPDQFGDNERLRQRAERKLKRVILAFDVLQGREAAREDEASRPSNTPPPPDEPPKQKEAEANPDKHNLQNRRSPAFVTILVSIAAICGGYVAYTRIQQAPPDKQTSVSAPENSAKEEQLNGYMLASEHSAFESFLRARAGMYRELQVAEFGDENLAYARSFDYFGSDFNPYFARGDFNADNRLDFAVVVATKGDTAPEDDVELCVAIFNGAESGGFELKHLEQGFVTSLSFFVHWTENTLFCSTFESDADTMEFTPTADGYAPKFGGR